MKQLLNKYNFKISTEKNTLKLPTSLLTILSKNKILINDFNKNLKGKIDNLITIENLQINFLYVKLFIFTFNRYKIKIKQLSSFELIKEKDKIKDYNKLLNIIFKDKCVEKINKMLDGTIKTFNY